tara:strand:+ start:653 stop:2098 length:1446 start_codon:yes stop_codon:yes gene_type:complete
MIKKIMLALPNSRWFELRCWHTFPYTLGLLTSVLKDKYEVKILDADIEDLSLEETKKRIAEYSPDIFCISCMSMEYAKSFKEMASIAKSAYPQTKVIIGGIYPTLLPEALMKDENIDYAIIGEGEYRLPKLLDYLENKNFPIEQMDGLVYRKEEKIITQPVISYIKNLDELPFPCYDNVNLLSYANKANKYCYFLYPKRFPYAYTITSRGCAFNCIFCSSKSVNGPEIRYRSAENVLKEIDWLVKEHKIKDLIFLDDNFYLDRVRAKKILQGLIERNYDLTWKSPNVAVYALDDEILELMKASGCYHIALAIESGTEEVLKLLRKPLKLSKAREVVKKAKSLGFEVTAMFVIGTPGETWEQIRQTFRFAEELDLDYAAFNIATPLPKTELYKIAKEKNLLPKDFRFDNLDFKGYGKASITTDEFTPEELQILRAFEWDRINFKNNEKAIKIAQMNGITMEQLNKWRTSTRRNVGVNVKLTR